MPQGLREGTREVPASRGNTLRRPAFALVAWALAACAGQGGDVASDTAAAINVAATPQPAETVTVYKSPTCGCCMAWVGHMRQNGFHVVAIDTNDLAPVKRRYGVAPEHESCHTATVGGYVIEGHVPAEEVRRLLQQRPHVSGLAVPGMPVGSPGMEGLYKQRYQVLAFTRGGPATVFASH